MPTWSKRALRGSYLEEIINRSNDIYKGSGLCLIQKIPTPITPVEYNNENHHITLAYFEKKSTVDYIGVVQGIPVCFDAKECAGDRFRISNIHEHQYEFMKDFEAQEGIAFLIIYYSKLEKYYYMRFSELQKIYSEYKSNKIKSFSTDELSEEFFLKYENGFLRFLDGLNRDLTDRQTI